MDRREKNGKPGASRLPAPLVTAALMKNGFLNLYLASLGFTFFSGADGDWRSDAKKCAVLVADRLKRDYEFLIWLIFRVDRGNSTTTTSRITRSAFDKAGQLKRHIGGIRNLAALPARHHGLGNSKLFGNSHLGVTKAAQDQNVFLSRSHTTNVIRKRIAKAMHK